ncbi:MAG: Rrf2 family transcriptional regulator [Tissierellia bacterium]|nr:Rrf2 family transcriptional regulator [Tissierellia bacterium]
MKLSKKSEYSCLALMYLSKHYNSKLVTILEISVENKIPKKYLEQILIQLKNAGYVKSIRGTSGGYKLAKQPSEISLAEILRLIDGPLAPVDSASKFFYESTPIEQNEQLLNIFKDIRNYISDKLENTTFADLI